jgi:predicted lysophospholipase L1 biosynthesis ABC-type transport system permease subunit
MALGAERRGILMMVLRQGMELAVAGIVLGLVGAFALTRVMTGLLFNVSTMDIATFSLVPLALALTAAMTIIIPAMRGTRVDQVVARREE